MGPFTLNENKRGGERESEVEMETKVAFMSS